MRTSLNRVVSKGKLLRQQIWRQHEEPKSRAEAWLHSVLRVVAISFAGLRENRIVSRAAALSFSSLLGLGPLIALMVMVSGFVLDRAEPGTAQRTIEQVISFVAPQVNLSDETESSKKPEDGLSSLISRFIAASQSGTVGIGGALMLALVVIQLFITIEDAFNDIWGVARGRKLITRVILYWTIITVGAVVGFAGVARGVFELMALNEQFVELAESIPGGETVGGWLSAAGATIVTFLALGGMLALFYRFIPNTQVEWKAALVGAAFALVCFKINNTLAFLYVERVAMQRTLYGSLGILPVLMIGLYFFWLCLLVGGRVCFAVQNARFKSGRVAWDELSAASQEGLCLLLFAQVCRQFKNCLPPLSSNQLADRHGLPRQLVTAAMERLCDLKFASALPAEDQDPFDASRYQPAKPLDKITLADFKRSFDAYGESPDENHFDAYDPLVRHYHRSLEQARASAFQDADIATALDQLEARKGPKQA